MIVQFILSVLSIMAVAFSQSKSETLRRYACVAGLISQPFWMYATFIASQWGMFALAIIYTFIWGKSFVNNFINYKKENI